MPVVDRSDPRTYPEPMDEGWGALNLLSILALAVGAVVFVPLACPLTTTRGATRSARLQWEERRNAAEQAIAQENASATEEFTHLRHFQASADQDQQDWQP